MVYRYPKKIRNSVMDRVKAGERRDNIAAEFGISSKTIQKWMKMEGVSINPPRMTEETRQELMKLYKSGLSSKELAYRLNVSISQVNYTIRKMVGVRKKHHEESVKYVIVSRCMAGDDYKTLSSEYGVSASTIKDWMRGKKIRGLSADQIKEARRRVEAGESKAGVARELGVGENAIRNVTSDIRRSLPPIPQEKRDEFVRRVRRGESHVVAARELGISPGGNSEWAIRAMNEVSAEEVEKIRALLREKKSVRYIAAKLEVPRAAVNKLRSEMSGRSSQRTRYSDEIKEIAIRACEEGKSYKEVAELVGAQEGSVSYWFNNAVKEGLAVRPGKRIPDSSDVSFEWIDRDFPHLTEWRQCAVDWVNTPGVNFAQAVRAVSSFIKEYLHPYGLPPKKCDFFKRGASFPDFYLTICDQDTQGARKNNQVHDFLKWILAHPEFSDIDDDGNRILLPIYRNPLKWVTHRGLPSRNVSVRSVLPYHHLDELRALLVQGESFSDWTLAHQLIRQLNDRGAVQKSTDWFRVDEAKIDKKDPDCVWRVRERLRAEPVIEMWSPVRWVVLLIKLLTPARTGQIRMSDSGESDTYRFSNGKFEINRGPLAEGTTRSPWQQGIIRRTQNSVGGDSKVLFFNSNKTADIAKRGFDIGQECPWPEMPARAHNPYFWLEKLRNWQEKYNPISRRTAWAEVPCSRELSPMSAEAKGKYLPTCFLFRTPEMPGEEHLPVSNGVVTNAWHALLRRYQRIIDGRGDKNADGSLVRIYDDAAGNSEFTLHGLRVSLITHLIVDGGLPPEVMQRIVGHSRLVMTFYYTKPSVDHIKTVVADAAVRLDSLKDERSIKRLSVSPIEELGEGLVFNTTEWKRIIAADPSDRNPAGWLVMHDGICLAGGNTMAIDGNSRLPGCHNGGPKSTLNDKDYEPVPGGPRNCARCRWKVYEKAHAPAVVASLNNKFYHLHCRQGDAVKAERDVISLKKAKAEAGALGLPFLDENKLITAQRLYESAMVRLDHVAADACALFRTIQRIGELPDCEGGGMKLVAQGGVVELHTIFEEAPSELLQLSVLCSDIEVYPDLDPGTAIYRRSQLLDGALAREGYPPVFMRLTEEEMLSYGNAYMKKLALLVNPGNEALGLRQIISVIDSGEALFQALGVSLSEVLPTQIGEEMPQSFLRNIIDREGSGM